MIKRAMVVLMISLTGVWAADSLTKEELPLSATDELALEHPARVQFAVVKESEDGFRPAIRLQVTGADGSAQMVFKIYAGKILSDGPLDQEELNAAVKKMGLVYELASVEKTNEVRDLHLPQAGSFGAYEMFTDASLVGVAQPAAGDYRVITVGLVRIGGYLFTIQGGSNDKDGTDVQAVLGVLTGLKLEALPAQGSSTPPP